MQKDEEKVRERRVRQEAGKALVSGKLFHLVNCLNDWAREMALYGRARLGARARSA